MKKEIKKLVWFIYFIAAYIYLVDLANLNTYSFSLLDLNLLDLPMGQPYY